MNIEAIGTVAGIIALGRLLWDVAVSVRRIACRKEGAATVLAGLSVVALLTLAAVLLLLWRR